MAQGGLQDALPVTPSVITWARVNAGFSLDDAQRSFTKIAAWEAGDASPTYPQLEQMSEKFKCPVAVFFFPEPPDVAGVEKSFRTLLPDDFAQIPRTVRTFLRKGQAMQLNLAELNDGKNPAPKVITHDLKFEVNTTIDTIANAIRDYLGVSLKEQSNWPSLDEAMEQWRDAFARVGVYVFKDAFRSKAYFGFCLFDDEFPIIYVNNSSTKSRQIFTLFHELGHLLFHTSGIDILDDHYIAHLPNEQRKIEIICNRLAARLLIPDDEFDRLLAGKKPTRDAAAIMADYFHVSREAIYRTFLDRGLISEGEYIAAAKDWQAQIKKSAGTGNYYNSHFSYLGRHYIDLAFARYYQRRIDEFQLSDYLNIKPKNLATFELMHGTGR